MRLHHVGYATSNITKSQEAFAKLGYRQDGTPTVDETRHVRIQFMLGEAGDRIELIEPLDDEAPIYTTLKSQRGSTHPYHMCFETENIDAAISGMRNLGWLQMGPIRPAPAIGDSRVAFLFGKSAGLIELVEKGGGKHGEKISHR